MKLFDRFKSKVEDEIEEIKCDICGNTLKDYKNSKNKKVCEECFAKINEE